MFSNVCYAGFSLTDKRECLFGILFFTTFFHIYFFYYSNMCLTLSVDVQFRYSFLKSAMQASLSLINVSTYWNFFFIATTFILANKKFLTKHPGCLVQIQFSNACYTGFSFTDKRECFYLITFSIAFSWFSCYFFLSWLNILCGCLVQIQCLFV